MRIDEFEFRNKQGEEIEPTKTQLVIYIKGLHKQIKELYTQNTDFNQSVVRYMNEFEQMTKMVQNEDENKLLMSILIGSDIGRLYMVLADVLKRQDA